DLELCCKDCQCIFIFTVGEQEFYAEKGFEGPPQRCRDCRQAKKTRFEGGGGGGAAAGSG
ncbi:putative zinc-binding domain-containing protein, partial [Tribonema minus]